MRWEIEKWVCEYQPCAIVGTQPKHIPPLRPITALKLYVIVGFDVLKLDLTPCR